jgi:tRNA/tmRNA/rRNA uracil-C5-methylase (TrmA/RlmC/RlmD family)
MTERERIEVAETKIRKCQEQGNKCGVCGKPITPYNLQLAHKVEKSKANLKKYGKQIIHHPMNLVAVCSLKCNDAVLLSPKTHPIEANELIEEIRRNL